MGSWGSEWLGLDGMKWSLYGGTSNSLWRDYHMCSISLHDRWHCVVTQQKKAFTRCPVCAGNILLFVLVQETCPHTARRPFSLLQFSPRGAEKRTHILNFTLTTRHHSLGPWDTYYLIIQMGNWGIKCQTCASNRSCLLPEYLPTALLRASHIWDVINSRSMTDRIQSMKTPRNSP